MAGPVGLAAIAGRIPLVLSEADSHLGITNRTLAPLAKRVCLAFPIEGRTGDRYVVTGRPVPPPATDRVAARERFNLAPDDTCVLVFGGSLGARSINEAAIQAFLDAPYRVIHAAGERDMRRRCSRACPRTATTCGPTSSTSARRSLASDLVRRPLGRVDLRGRRARASRDPRSRTRTRPATTRPPTRGGWPRPAPRWSSPTTS